MNNIIIEFKFGYDECHALKYTLSLRSVYISENLQYDPLNSENYHNYWKFYCKDGFQFSSNYYGFMTQESIVFPDKKHHDSNCSSILRFKTDIARKNYIRRLYDNVQELTNYHKFTANKTPELTISSQYWLF